MFSTETPSWLMKEVFCVVFIIFCLFSRELSHDQGFVDEMRRNLRFIVAVFLRRLQKVRGIHS